MARSSLKSAPPTRSLITVLGSGTSTGIPIIGCDCKVCRSRNPKNKRLRASIWIQAAGKSILVDTSTDLRQQALTHRIRHLDAVLFTHPHADHVHGIDELRCYNFIQRAPIPIFGNAWTCDELPPKFPYIFSGGPAEGGGIPQLVLHRIDASADSFDVAGVEVVPIPLSHGSMESVGYRVGRAAYVTDCSRIPAASRDRMRGLDALILDCVRLKPHNTHFNLDQALEVVADVRPRRTWLTHMGHDFEHVSAGRKLPKGVAFAFDGLRIKTG